MIYIEVRLDHPILREALHRVPEMEVEWERNVASGDGRQLLFWAHGGDFDAFETALEADPTVTSVSRSIDAGGQCLYQVELAGEGAVADLFPILVDTGSVVRRATVTHDGWNCRFLFAEQSALDRFFGACDEHGIAFEVNRLYEPREVGDAEFELTAAQRETLLVAVESGYFEVPRETDLRALGDRLGISDTAVSQRLRRGMKTLVNRTIGSDP